MRQEGDRRGDRAWPCFPFLAAGETHKSGQRYQKTVRNGLEYLVKCCPLAGPNAGKFTGAGNMYAQAIGTVALCEAYGMTRDKVLLLPTCQAAINYIQRAQAGNGSWGYQSGSAGDTSIVGWQIQALQAARLSKDIVVDKRVIDNAIRFLNFASTGSRKSAYGYNDNSGAQPGTALTAVGLLCRYYIDGWGPDNGGMAEGVQGLMKRAPNTDGTAKGVPGDMYFYYYATQVVHFFEGEEWKQWNEGTKQKDGTRKGGMRDLAHRQPEHEARRERGKLGTRRRVHRPPVRPDRHNRHVSADAGGLLPPSPAHQADLHRRRQSA